MSRNKKSIRSKSIARRLNAALTRRSFAKTVLIDLLAAAVVMVTWCLTVENANGGSLATVHARSFGGSCDVLYNTVQCSRDIARYCEELRAGDRPEGDITLPFDGVYYMFTVKNRHVDQRFENTEYVVDTEVSYAEPDGQIEYFEVSLIENDETSEEATYDDHDFSGIGETVEQEIPYVFNTEEGTSYAVSWVSTEQTPKERVVYVDASSILSTVTVAFILLFVCQFLTAILRSLSGGGLIKRYLRPIDDIALMAEQLSSESYTTSEDEIRKNYITEKNKESDAEQNESVLDMHDVESFADAIDEIADSRARIDVHAPELSGLEAAVNNMLKRLEEGRRKQIRFVDDASHELRTPISVIQGYANMLDRWGKDDPKVRDEAIEAIKTEAEHIKTLLDQLLFLARGEMDRHVLELKPLSVDEMLAEIMEESQMLDRKHIYEMTLASGERNSGAEADSVDEKEASDYADKDVRVLADAAMIKQSVRILCDNSVRYTPEGGTIALKSNERVRADAHGRVQKEVCIEVADTGIGISADELPRIFDRFYRGENARSDNTGGSGLGLSIARWIVEQHNGRIEAISSPGFGTKMSIILPSYEE